MWQKKKWMIVAVLAATLVLLAGIIGGVAYAQTDTQTNTDPTKTLLARVATILGIDQTKLEDAFSQAQKEMQDEALSDQLQSLVDEGKITQQQADQYKQWWQSRPDLPSGLDFRGGMGFHGGFPGPGPGLNPPPASSTSTASTS